MRILEWDDFIAGPAENEPASLTIGVFDGVHRGHKALIERICASSAQPVIVTFKNNPLRILNPHEFAGDIYSLERKTELFSAMGVKMTVLIDFSKKFSTLKGSEFFVLLARGFRIQELVLGQNFRCGAGLDTGIDEIRRLTGSYTAIRTVEPVMEGGRPVSSSRIRSALCAANFTEAASLVGRNADIDLRGLPVKAVSSAQDRCLSFNARNACRILPPDGVYRVAAYGCHETETAAVPETTVSVLNGHIIVPGMNDTRFKPARLEFVTE